MNITFIPEEYRTKEQDVRIELIKGFLNKSNLDYDELSILFDTIEQTTPSYSNYTLNDTAYNQFKNQLLGPNKEIILETIEISDAINQKFGLQLPKTYAEIEELLNQGYSIYVYNPFTELTSKIESLQKIGNTYYIYTLDNNFTCKNKNDYPFSASED